MNQQEAIRQALFEQGELSWLLHKSQLDVYQRLRGLPRSVRQAVVEISRRWGKSWLGVTMALEDALRSPNAQVLYVAPNIKQATSIIAPLIRDITQYAPEGLILRTKSEHRWTFSNGSALIIGGFDSASESFRGLRATSIYADESASADPEEFLYVVRSILLPTLLHSRGRITHLTTPSPLPSHPLHEEIVPECLAQDAHFVRTIYDNPLIDEQTIREFMRDVGGEHSVAWQREFLCRRAVESSAIVVPEFRPEQHVCAPDARPGPSNMLVAVDFGGVRDKTVGHLIAYEFQTGRVWFLDEYVADPNTPTGEIVAQLRVLEQAAQTHTGTAMSRVVDAPGQLLVDLKDTHGFACRLPAKDDWLASLNNLRMGFTEDQVRIHPRCRLLIATLKSGTFNKARNDFARTSALGHCDALAAAMYGFRSVDRWTNPVARALPGHDQWQRPQSEDNDAIIHALNPWAARRKRAI